MLSPEGFEAKTADLISRGYSRDVAELYVCLLGDTIEEDLDGRWIVRDRAGQIIDRVDPMLSDDLE